GNCTRSVPRNGPVPASRGGRAVPVGRWASSPPTRRRRHTGAMTATLDDHPIHSWLTDMDGVLVHEEAALPGAAEFISALQQFGRPFLALPTTPTSPPPDRRARLSRSGIDIPEESIWTSALATARFLAEQQPGAAAYVIGEAGLTSAMHDEGF